MARKYRLKPIWINWTEYLLANISNTEESAALIAEIIDRSSKHCSLPHTLIKLYFSVMLYVENCYF